jgi:hypothetical protein
MSREDVRRKTEDEVGAPADLAGLSPFEPSHGGDSAASSVSTAAPFSYTQSRQTPLAAPTRSRQAPTP